jgi:hypothetical protein
VQATTLASGSSERQCFSTHVPSEHDWEQQSELAWQYAPTSRHSVGWGLVAPGWTFVVLDELKQPTASVTMAAGKRQRTQNRILAVEARRGPPPVSSD